MSVRQRAFTLIEVLAAVVVLAIALSAILAGMARYADDTAYLNQKTIALIVAHNRLTEMELAQEFPAIGKSDDDVQMAGVKWHWRAEVVATEDPSLRRVNIHVQAPGRKDDVVSLSSFIGHLQ